MNVNLVTTATELNQVRANIPESEKVGFVPTMGNLHAGHCSLIKMSLEDNDVTIVSIFVNPQQFNNAQDLSNYPRTLDEDIHLIESLHQNKRIIIFAPQCEKEIYGDNFGTFIHVLPQSQWLEGAQRPGHFQGVTTVVYLLFQLISPHVAYFGKKDYQQLRIIEKMVQNLKIPIKIISAETVREVSKLALSSRNNHLTSKGRKQAALLFTYLIQLHEKTLLLCKSKPMVDYQFLQELEVLIESLKINDPSILYLEVRNQNLSTIEIGQKAQKLVALGAYQVENIRLIDNVEITP